MAEYVSAQVEVRHVSKISVGKFRFDPFGNSSDGTTQASEEAIGQGDLPNAYLHGEIVCSGSSFFFASHSSFRAAERRKDGDEAAGKRLAPDFTLIAV